MQLAGDGSSGRRGIARRRCGCCARSSQPEWNKSTPAVLRNGHGEELIREALHSCPDDLAIVRKVAARREADGAPLRFDEPHELRQGIEDNLPRSAPTSWRP